MSATILTPRLQRIKRLALELEQAVNDEMNSAALPRNQYHHLDDMLRHVKGVLAKVRRLETQS